MACRSCGGKITQPMSSKTLLSVPELEENEELYLTYIAPGVGTHRPKGETTGVEYYFKSSPRNQTSKKVVYHENPDPQTEVNYDDALYLTELKFQDYNLYAWNVKSAPKVEEPKEVIEADVIEKPVEETEEVTQPVPLESKYAIDSLSISQAKESLTYEPQSLIVKLLEDEREGKNRKGMIDVLESLLIDEEE